MIDPSAGQIRVAMVNDSLANACAFNIPPCGRPGLQPERTLELLAMVLPQFKPNNAVFIPATEYGFYSEQSFPQEREDGSSIMRMIYRGLADISPPDSYYSIMRASVLKEVGMLGPTKYVWVYRTPGLGTPHLNLTTLNLPLTLFLAIAATAILSFLIKTVAIKVVGEVSAADFCVRNKFLLTFFFGIFLKVLSSDFVLLFARVRGPTQPFHSTSQIVSALEAKQFKALAVWEITYQRVLYPLASGGAGDLHDRLIANYKFNTPLLMPNYESALQLVLRSDGPQYILCMWAAYLPIIRSKFCGFSVIYDNYFSTGWTTAFFGKNTSIPFMQINSRMRGTFEQIERKVFAKYYPPKTCYAQESPDSLDIYRIQLPFWLILYMLIYLFIILLSIALVICESLFDRIVKCESRKDR